MAVRGPPLNLSLSLYAMCKSLSFNSNNNSHKIGVQIIYVAYKPECDVRTDGDQGFSSGANREFENISFYILPTIWILKHPTQVVGSKGFI